MSTGYHKHSLLDRALDPSLEPEPLPPPVVEFIEGDEVEGPLFAIPDAERATSADQDVEAWLRKLDPETRARAQSYRSLSSWTNERLAECVASIPAIERVAVFLDWALDAMILREAGFLSNDEAERWAVAMIGRAAEVELPNVPGVIDPVAVRKEITEVMLGSKVDSSAIDRVRRVRTLLKVAAKNAAQSELGDLPALSDQAAAVYEMLCELPVYSAMTGPRLLEKLDGKGITIDQSTLTKRIIPELGPYGIENQPRIGYRIPESRRLSDHAPHKRP